MKTKHTPGPWLLKMSTPTEQNKKWGGNCGANCYIFVKTGKKIMGVELTNTICSLPHWRDEKETPENEANAQLIAAAPELLLALTDLIEIATNFGVDGPYMEKAKKIVKPFKPLSF